MANRVVLDPNNGWFRVSKPGVDVLTADDFGLIFREYASGLVPALQGEVIIQDQPVVVPLPEAGFVPIVFAREQRTYAGVTFWVPRTNGYDTVNAEKTALTLSARGGGRIVRYTIFKNRQF